MAKENKPASKESVHDQLQDFDWLIDSPADIFNASFEETPELLESLLKQYERCEKGGDLYTLIYDCLKKYNKLLYVNPDVIKQRAEKTLTDERGFVRDGENGSISLYELYDLSEQEAFSKGLLDRYMETPKFAAAVVFVTMIGKGILFMVDTPDEEIHNQGLVLKKRYMDFMSWDEILEEGEITKNGKPIKRTSLFKIKEKAIAQLALQFFNPYEPVYVKEKGIYVREKEKDEFENEKRELVTRGLLNISRKFRIVNHKTKETF